VIELFQAVWLGMLSDDFDKADDEEMLPNQLA
jgi:hypothetical protein